MTNKKRPVDQQVDEGYRRTVEENRQKLYAIIYAFYFVVTTILHFEEKVAHQAICMGWWILELNQEMKN